MTQDEYIQMAEATAEAAYKRCADKHIPEIMRQIVLDVFASAINGIASAATLDPHLKRAEAVYVIDSCVLLSRAFTETYGTKKGAAHAGY